MTTNRLEAFSDGVFAVAITLLIFNVQVPHVADAEVGGALLALWPAYASYVVSFLTIGIIWVNHHGLFGRVQRIDRTLLFLNLTLLMTVAFLPFPTALLGDYILGRQASRIAAVMYGITMILLSLTFIATWAYVSFGHGFLAAPVNPRSARARLPWFGLGLLGYTLAIAIAFVSAPLSLAICGIMAVYYLFDHLPVIDRRASEKSEPAALPTATVEGGGTSAEVSGTVGTRMIRRSRQRERMANRNGIESDAIRGADGSGPGGGGP
jgi:uncharacterized membrane protein